MPFTEAVKVMLYARSGNRCAFPGCPISLVFTEKHANSVVNFGKAAHIVAEKTKGPRGRSNMSLQERNSYQNGIILCGSHHNDVVDKMPEKFPVRMLRAWKAKHERTYGNVNSSRRKGSGKYLTTYAEYIDQWAEQARIDGWMTWTGPLLRAGAYYMSPNLYADYLELLSWLANRVWPGKLRHLENAFDNFRRVGSDLFFTFERHSDESESGHVLRTDKFYARNGRHSSTSLAEYEYHVKLLEDLTFELTRAANLICDRIRESVDAQFRIEEGRLAVETGMDMNFGFRRYVPQYASRERTARPYPGLREFMTVRKQRDIHSGDGVNERYFGED